MARGPRLRSKSGIYHVMLRGINKQTIFEDDEDKYRFLYTVKEYSQANSYSVYGYCIMDNHVHLLLQEVEDGVSTALRKIGASYVFWYNKKYERCGPLFQDRFKSETVESDKYLWVVLRYIHYNPIKAGICKSLNDYPWSSYKEYIDKPSLVDSDFCLDSFSKHRDKAIELFIEFMNEETKDECLDFENYVRLTDDQVKNMIKEKGISNISELQTFERKKRNHILKELKSINGISLRQLSRITGISRSLIGRL